MSALTILLVLVAYFLGSISSAVLVCQLFRLPDPRTTGSGNPGATNVYRLGGRYPAILTLVFDVLKGTLPVWGSYFLGLHPIELGMVAIAACVGHIYPLFFSFKGGKGVATALGAMLPIGLDLSGMLIVTWVVTVFFTGYSSMGALVTVSMAPVFTWFIKPQYSIPVLMLSILIIARHRSNLLRLWQGKESKVWDKGKTNE